MIRRCLGVCASLLLVAPLAAQAPTAPAPAMRANGAPLTVEQFAQLPFLIDPLLSPDGNRIAATAFALLSVAAAAPSAAARSDNPAAEVRRVSRLAESACPDGWRSETLIHKARQLAGAGYIHRPECPPDPDLALLIAEAVAAEPSADSDDAYLLLSWLAQRGAGRPADAAQAREYSRRAWLLGYQTEMADDVEPPFADSQARLAYLRQPATIAFLRDFRTRADLVSIRARLALALIVRDAPGESAEAIALLDARDRGEAQLVGLGPELEGLARALRLRRSMGEASDAPARAGALAELRQLPWLDGGAKLVLSEIALRRFAAASSADERLEALEWLGVLAAGRDPSFIADFHEVLAAASAGQVPATVASAVSAAARQHLSLDPAAIEYPSSALRSDDEGTVRLRGLIDPRGRLIFTEATEPAPALSLVNALRGAYARRPPPPIELGAARTSPFMWIELPPVAFRIRRD